MYGSLCECAKITWNDWDTEESSRRRCIEYMLALTYKFQFQFSSYANAFGRTRLFAYLNKHEHNTQLMREKKPYNRIDDWNSVAFANSPYLLSLSLLFSSYMRTEYIFASWSMHIDIDTTLLLLPQKESLG